MDLEFLLRRNKNDDKKEEVEWDPEPLHNCCYMDNNCTKALVSTEKKFEGYFYVVDFKEDRPIDAIPAPKIRTSFMSFDKIDPDIFIVGFIDGSFQIRHRNDLKNSYLSVLAHDKDYGKVNRVCVSFDQTSAISAAEDGTMITYKLDFPAFKNASRGEMPTTYIHPELG